MKITLLNGYPKEIAVAGTLGCTSTKSSAEILTDLQSLDELSRNQKCENILKNSFGRGHGAVGDQTNFTFSLSDVTRLTTLFLCQSPFASFLQQSMRHVKTGGYKLPESLLSKKYAKVVVDKAFGLYNRMIEGGIPEEDARYVLPLCSTTNIQMNVNARGLCQLSAMARSENVGSEGKSVARQLLGNVAIEDGMALVNNYGMNYEPLSFYPAPDLFGESDILVKGGVWDNCTNFSGDVIALLSKEELKDGIKNRKLHILSTLNHIHFTFGIGLSLAAFHQAVRQRTWDHCVETLENAINQKNRKVIPPSIGLSTEFFCEFVKLHDEMVECCNRLVSEGIPKSEAFNLIPHSLKIYDLIHINGWNAIHSLGKRCCSKAQWEIRGIANKAKQIIEDQYPELGRYVGPQCLTYGVCPESKPCGMVEKFKKERK